MGSCVFPVFIGLILLQIPKISECHKIEVTPDSGTIITFSKKAGQGLDCSVCKDEGPSQTCNSNLKLTEARPTIVTFNCSQPGDIFTVEINQEIDCSTTGCSIIAVHPDSTRFLEFSRTFTWDLKVLSGRMFQLDFPSPGMRQIKPSESCPDKHTYTIITYQRAGPANIGTFCGNGTISRIQVLYKGRVALEVPKGTDLNPSNFKLSMGPAATALVEVDVKLPGGPSSADFFTPNYATGYYNEEKIKWNFAVKPMHNFTVYFQHYTPPECQKNIVMCDYALGDKTSFTKAPTDIQPANKQGDFSLTLTNCDAKKGANVPGLSLNFNVEVFRSGIPYLCTVDLRNEEGLSLQIENKNPESYCEMSLNSVIQEKIVVPAGTKADLSFLDCPVQDLQLTATKVIDCSSVSARDVSGTPLTIPALDPSLPVPLHQFTWLLRVWDQGTVDLMSPKGDLHQSVPDKQCNERVSLVISETEGSNIGLFCSAAEGAIQKIQIKGNVSITVTPNNIKDLSQEKEPFLKFGISPEITENVIYTVSPLISGPTYFATPNWPDGMNPSSSASWIVYVPQEYQAELLFSNIVNPTCDSGHTEVTVGPLNSQGQTQSWREDQSFTSPVVQQQSFYLNMSNCEPKSGRFAVLSKISLQKETKKFLGIILAVVGVLLLLVIIAIIVVCVIRKRKNKPKTNRSSIYIPRGKPVLPGNAGFPKSRADNESHVYASIDDPTMYGHLDKNQPAEVDSGAWSNGHQVDMYRPFTGPTDSIPAATDLSAEYSLDTREGDAFQPFLNPTTTFNLPRPRSPLVSQGSLGFEDHRMMANALNTFKSGGDINPIRLSADESRLQPQMDSDSDSYPEPEYEEAM
ncbi:CUB domain-containing protein 1 [Sinocyclocheilus grahami]|uniref:CUB domain-containing protein 1 n=1 Tax=Sinocyclocheilus grahami TaxID=75366 RepID=UPI0007ACD4F9|nr:PREDICTED: CUB domain-containing protein 1-like [Sinocyclocheilus grahami]XP_016099106.1 PREDICTED: CUB domain-containing protein 1-like [Sinocyclocheilus grahami]